MHSYHTIQSFSSCFVTRVSSRSSPILDPIRTVKVVVSNSSFSFPSLVTETVRKVFTSPEQRLSCCFTKGRKFYKFKDSIGLWTSVEDLLGEKKINIWLTIILEEKFIRLRSADKCSLPYLYQMTLLWVRWPFQCIMLYVVITNSGLSAGRWEIGKKLPFFSGQYITHFCFASSTGLKIFKINVFQYIKLQVSECISK